MNRNIFTGAMLIGVLAFASCSTQKLTSNQSVDDDVYFTKAKAGEQVPMQIAYNQNVYANPQDQSGSDSDDDYYYYDSYASRINRFSYNSPFNYYDDYYYDYASTPTTSGYGGYDLNAYAYGGYGWGLGIGFGYGGFYSPWGYGYGYGGYPFWGIYSAYGYGGGYYGGGYYGGGYGYGGGYRGTPRPFRGSGSPGIASANRSVRGIGYSGAYQNAGYYPGRSVNANGRRVGTNGYGSGNYNNGQQGRQTRATRTDYPTYQPTRTTTNSMPSSSGGGGNSGGGGGGGSRPVRP